MQRQVKGANERERRVYMAGLSFSQMAGFKSARDLCANTLLFAADIDTDTIVFYDDAINLDAEQVKSSVGDSFSAFWQNAVDAYVDDSIKDMVRDFLSTAHLRDSFERGRLSECIEYPCIVAGDTLWMRASYELRQNEEGHVCVQVLLVNMTLYHAPDDLDRA